MNALLERFKNDAFLKNAMIFLTGSGLVAFINYLFHPVLSRVLPVDSFGEVQALLALFTELTSVFAAFTQTAIHASANCDFGCVRRLILR